MKYYITIIFSFFILLSFSIVQADSKSVEYHDYDPLEMVNHRIINEWDPDPYHRVETFTDKNDWMGLSDDGSDLFVHGWTTQSAESFDGQALYLSSPDDVNWAGGYTNLWPGNSSTYQTFEFDIMWEVESGKGFQIDFWDTSDNTINFKLNISTDAWSSDGLYTVYFYGYRDTHHIDDSIQLGYIPSDATWHHVIFSYIDDIVNGFQATMVFDNVTFNWTREKLGISSTHDWIFRIKPEEHYVYESNEYGMDIIIDNIACYNTSYTTAQIKDALDSFYNVPGTPTPDDEDILVTSLLELLPMMILIIAFTGLLKKFN